MTSIGIVSTTLDRKLDIGVLVQDLDGRRDVLSRFGNNDAGRLDAAEESGPVIGLLGVVIDADGEEDALRQGFGDFLTSVLSGGGAWSRPSHR